MEGRLERVADGVRLYHVAHKAKGEDQGNGEEAREDVSEHAVEFFLDVVHRAAGDFPVNRAAVFLGKRGLAVDRRHAEEGAQPHPEDGARAAGVECGGCARDVARADLRRHRRRKRLKRAHAVLAGLIAVQADVAEHSLESLFELAHLHKSEPHSEPDSRPAQQNDQNHVLQPCVDRADGRRQPIYELCREIHCVSSGFLL